MHLTLGFALNSQLEGKDLQLPERSSAVLDAQLLERMVHWNKLNLKQSVDVGFWNFQECADFFFLLAT